ncbi:accessory Sec system glycosyltransferase Asp1 [Lactococcus lactis]|nr:accessory Sec system glycosyltransferase Asp1 [Lactococcus lactis]
MIYFLTDWQTEQPQLESNIVFNVSQIFCEGALETKVINAQLCPFSNYFTNPFEFYDSEHFINLLDPVTEHFALSYAPLTLSDLQFPTTWEKTYTRKNVLLSEGGIIKAEVFFNSFGFVSQVHYHSHLGKEIHIYSEKGVLLTKKVIDSSGVRVEQQVFDEGGQVILTQWRDYVFIEKNYQKRFKKITYQSFKEVCIELINGALVKFNSKEDQLIIDGTSEWLMSLVEGFEFPESIVYIFTGPTQTCISQLNLHFNLIEKGKLIISDNEDLQKICHSLSLYQSIKGKVKIMALYPTTLALGESNSTLEEYFYWQIERFDAHESQLLKKILKDEVRNS